MQYKQSHFAAGMEAESPKCVSGWEAGLEADSPLAFRQPPLKFVEQAQIAYFFIENLDYFCQSVTFLADIARGIMVVIESLTRKATKTLIIYNHGKNNRN